MKASLILVDDSQSIADLIIPVLEGAGYDVRHASSADDALASLKQRPADLMLLDISLPGISGLKLLQILKEERSTAGLPIIMISVESKEAVKLQGLGGGADDYLVKPFSTKELLARVDALLRRVRNSGKLANVLEAGGISVDLDRREVTARGKRVDLSAGEFALLTLFLGRKGHVLDLRTIGDSLSQGKETTSNNVYAHVKNLRAKLGASAERIETVHGVGYRFRDDSE